MYRRDESGVGFGARSSGQEAGTLSITVDNTARSSTFKTTRRGGGEAQQSSAQINEHVKQWRDERRL